MCWLHVLLLRISWSCRALYKRTTCTTTFFFQNKHVLFVACASSSAGCLTENGGTQIKISCLFNPWTISYLSLLSLRCSSTWSCIHKRGRFSLLFLLLDFSCCYCYKFFDPRARPSAGLWMTPTADLCPTFFSLAQNLLFTVVIVQGFDKRYFYNSLYTLLVCSLLEL